MSNAQDTHCACVSSTLATSASGSAWPSTCIASPLLAPPPPLMVTLESASRASSLSRDSRAITRVAASFWYRAVLSSCRVCASCCLSVCVSSTMASHSFWKALSSAGIDVRFGARGVTTWGDLSSMRSSTARSSPETGSVWFSAMWASIRRFSKTLPLLRDATGSRGASPEIAQSIFGSLGVLVDGLAVASRKSGRCSTLAPGLCLPFLTPDHDTPDARLIRVL
jgi:hypothetical protein